MKLYKINVKKKGIHSFAHFVFFLFSFKPQFPGVHVGAIIMDARY